MCMGQPSFLRAAYGAGVVLRLLSVLSMAMVHPDEYFQCPEVMAKSIFNIPHAFIPWEYKDPPPNRSVFFPSLVAGLPYALWKALGLNANGLAFLLLPRLVLLALSFTYDYTIVAICRRFHVDATGPLFALSTSWTTWVFLTRPFSNTCESFLLLLTFLALFQLPATTRRTALLGLVLACGTFTRFTFILFFFPAGLYLVWDNDRHLMRAASKKATDGGRTSSVSQRLVGVAHTAAVGAVSFAATAFAIVLLDTRFFQGSLAPPFVVAPWNNFIYNMDPSHLADHGLHPHTNHWLVNMPLLFGPLVPCLLVAAASRAPRPVHLVCLASIAFPVSLLSLAPHQEARFLLPVALPLFLATGATLVSHRALQLVWLVFNIALGLWFGVLHQGGLVSFLLASSGSVAHHPLCASSSLSPIMDNVHAIVITGTYMPPRFALSPRHLPLDDVPLARLHATLETHRGNSVLLAFPDPLAHDVDAIVAAMDGVRRVPAMTCWPFLSTESFPTNVANTSTWTLHVEHLSWST
ncbi:Aste57867_387 [Aphanomyces stellatus]|uniref:Mannosyltransferase n=1 Tax=Aphanomyces stellatus TaxID=120398 RepID=A0A485K7G4_9STRA|nr:hypothetical protein As57867_000386 [Aphanomyces stellatus]VFT77612.1 Aste57867_387 [Aphanomyces stellatus]